MAGEQLAPSIPDPSISPAPSMRTVPQHLHSLHQKDSSVLSLAGDEEHLFSGSQGQDIFVWDRRTFQLKTTLEGHTGPVLALEVSREKKWLFSSSGDSTVRVWSTTTLAPLYVIVPHLGTDAGDIFSLSFSPALCTVFFGCQNTSLQWVDLSHPEQLPRAVPENRPPSKRDKFFESGVRSGVHTPSYYAQRQSKPLPLNLHVLAGEPRTLYVPAANCIDSAHYGYIYCMALLPSPLITSTDAAREDGAVELVTGSGDEDVKVWLCTQDGGPVLQHTFNAGEGGGVLSLVARARTVYAGCQAGFVKVWDLETRTLVRTIIAQENVDVLSLSMIDSDLYSCSANGWVQRWSGSFECTAAWRAHDGIVLSSIIACDPSTSCANTTPSSSPASTSSSAASPFVFVTGANDSTIRLWSIDRPRARPAELGAPAQGADTLLFALEKFVAFPSVSGCAGRREDCRQAAIWLKKCLSQLGAEAQLLPTESGADGEKGHPLVLATFGGACDTERRRPRVLFYGHYDVIDAPNNGWETDPYAVEGRDGYLYGRGVTDNKGPILAAACAASDLLSRRALDIDVVMLVEGEEEIGSPGFGAAVRQYKDQIGHIDAILVSNSYWIGEDTPCITYGLRGVVHSTIEILSQRADVHSGVDGGAVSEPMIEMIKLLSTLTNGQKVLLPSFYDAVRPITSRELEQFELLAKVTHEPVARLSSRWREPSLSVHGLQVSGPGNATVIPAKVKATVSLRVVPDQDTDTVARTLVDHLELDFKALQSPNKLTVTIERKADWWLGDLDDAWFQALEGAIKDEWGVSPLRIREGGSIPPIPFLEKEFGCTALQLPLGQSSDQAHLANERISLENLRRGKTVIERFFTRVARFETKAP